MYTHLELRCASLEDLRSFVDGHGQGGVWMLPAAETSPPPSQYAHLQLHVVLPDASGALEVEVLQVMPGAGLVVRLLEPGLVDELLADVAPAVAPAPPQLRWLDEAEVRALGAPAEASAEGTATDAASTGATAPAGAPEAGEASTPSQLTGPAAWPIEKLLLEWNDLSVPDRILVAKRGQLAARRHVVKQQDRTLHAFVLANPGITADEVAAMAAMGTLDPELLKRIASRTEWLRHSSVVRNLICNPKTPLDLVERLLGKLPETELRKLTKTGRVRDAVKRLIIARVSSKP